MYTTTTMYYWNHINTIIGNKMRVLLISLATAISFLASAQSKDQNYVMSRHLLDDKGAAIATVAYYNGMGDMEETVTSGSGTAESVYTYLNYDSKRHERRAFCPVPIGNGLSYENSGSIVQASADFYKDNNAFQQYSYDTAGRTVRVDLSGKAWHEHNAHTQATYGTNTPADKVIRYKLPLAPSGFYPAGCLEKTSVTDADGRKKITFRDLDGNIILERRSLGDTYYIYNNLGQLRYVLTPEYQNHPDLSVFAYQYEYDVHDNLVKKILPGAQYTQYWYDKDGRCVFSQDAGLRSKGLYHFYFYDRIGRLAVSGVSRHCKTNIGNIDVTVTASQSGDILHSGYKCNATDIIEPDEAIVEKINYYDSYDFLSGSHKVDFDSIAPSQKNGANGRPTGTMTRATNGQYIFSAYSYDPKGNIIEALSKGLDGYTSKFSYTYTLTNQLQTSSGCVNVRYGKKLNITQQNAYSTRNGLLASKTITLDHGTSPNATTIGYEYDALNRLAKIIRPKEVGPVTFDYDVHGWPTKIETKSYKEYLFYADGPGTPCYNGNISSQKWTNSNYTPQRSYNFIYDNVNRLTKAEYSEGDGTSDATGHYDEGVAYDMNGNITALQRHGLRQDGTYGLIDDLKVTLSGNQLSSVTDAAGTIIREGALDFSTAKDGKALYRYNASGALSGDTGRGITNIEYDDNLNPVRIQFDNGSVTKYVYSADGAKLRVIHYTAMPNISVADGETHELTKAEIQAVDSIDYLLGGNLVVKNGRIDKYLLGEGYCDTSAPHCCITPPTLILPTEDKPLTKEQEEYNKKLEEDWKKKIKEESSKDYFVFFFYNSDHLGNNHEMVDNYGTVRQVVNYYPFGTPYCDATSSLYAGQQPYKFNSKEFDTTHGLNTYDYGARQYNSILPSWDRLDPLCEKYYSISPYAYCHDNPVNTTDPDGMDDYYDINGNFLGTNNNQTDYIYIANKFKPLGIWNGESHFGIYSRTALSKAELSAKTWSKILTRIAVNAGVKAEDLHNGAISVGVLERLNDNINYDFSDSYNDIDKCIGEGLQFYSASVMGRKNKNGSALITAFIYPSDNNLREYYSTVSNIQHLLYSHEYLGHYIKGMQDGITLDKSLINNPLFRKTTQGYQKHIFDRIKSEEQ